MPEPMSTSTYSEEVGNILADLTGAWYGSKPETHERTSRGEKPRG